MSPGGYTRAHLEVGNMCVWMFSQIIPGNQNMLDKGEEGSIASEVWTTVN